MENSLKSDEVIDLGEVEKDKINKVILQLLRMQNRFAGEEGYIKVVNDVSQLKKVIEDAGSCIKIIYREGKMLGYCMGISRKLCDEFEQTRSYVNFYNRVVNNSHPYIKNKTRANLQVCVDEKYRGSRAVKNMMDSTLNELFNHNEVLFATVQVGNTNMVASMIGYSFMPYKTTVKSGESKDVYVLTMSEDGKILSLEENENVREISPILVWDLLGEEIE